MMFAPPQRNYFLWLILGICTFGLGFLVYAYNNFNDMKTLSMGMSQKLNTPPHGSDPFVGLIAYLVCAPIGIFMKYGQLNELLNISGAQIHEPRPSSPVLVIILGICTFGLAFLYFEWKWQSTMNYHALKLITA
ncbi:MAG: hypothetical protein ACW99A_03000 [Candidatus Kariarchaeaceae archaeon]